MTQTVSLYDAAYTEGYNAALRDIRAKRRVNSHIKEYRPEESKQDKFERIGGLVMQKVAGAALLIASFIGLAATEGDFGVAFFTIPLSAFIIITNKKIFK